MQKAQFNNFTKYFYQPYKLTNMILDWIQFSVSAKQQGHFTDVLYPADCSLALTYSLVTKLPGIPANKLKVTCFTQHSAISSTDYVVLMYANLQQ